MANSNFIVHNGLQVGPLIIDADTGSITTTGTITSTGNDGEVFNGNIVANSGTSSTSSTTGALVANGGIGVSGNVFAGNFYFSNGLSLASAITAPYDLDDISPYTDSFKNTFALTYNQGNVTVASPWNLTVTLNGALQPAFGDNIESLWQSFVLSGSRGYTVVNTYWPNGSVQSGPLIKFADPLQRGTQVLLRSIAGTYSQSPKIYPFRPVDIVLGAD